MKLEGVNPQDRGNGGCAPRHLCGEGAPSRGLRRMRGGPGWRGHMPGPAPSPYRERGLKWHEMADHMVYATPAGAALCAPKGLVKGPVPLRMNRVSPGPVVAIKSCAYTLGLPHQRTE